MLFFFFYFWHVASSSQCCLSQLTDQIQWDGKKTVKYPNNFDLDSSSCVMIFTVIGHNTINTPGVFQAFMVLLVSLKWSWPCPKINLQNGKKVDCHELTRCIIFTNQYQILLSLYFLLTLTHWMLSSAGDKQVLWWASSDNGLQDYSVKKMSSLSMTHL